MVNLKSIALTLGLFTYSVLGGYKPPGAQRCSNEGRICLQRFLWCRPEQKNCEHPNYVVQRPTHNGQYQDAALITHEGYEIGWLGSDPEYTTVLEWSIPPRHYAPDNERIIWTRNFTGSSTWFYIQFEELAKDFPNEKYPNITAEHVLSKAQLVSQFTVSQPDRPWHGAANDSSGETSWRTSSDYFQVYDYTAKLYFDDERKRGELAERKRWKIPVIATVCSVVPVLMAASFFGGKFFESWRSRSRHVRIKSQE